jgi:TatD DNase family protein
MEKTIDIGVNLLNEQIFRNKTEIFKNAEKNNVEKIIGICNNLSDITDYSNFKIFEDNIFSTAGCHPHNANSFCKDLTANAQIIRDDIANGLRTVAVGECGLDYDRMFSTQENQIDCFAVQLGIAQEFNKPLYIHERNAFNDVYDFLKETGLGEKAVIHCFTGNKEHLKKYIDIGCYIGITGWVTDDKRGKDLQDAVKYLPLERLMIETDAPYLYPRKIKVENHEVLYGKNGIKINEPANVIYVADKIAEIKNINSDEIKRCSYENAINFFNLKEIC